jgi:uncharacterized membrane protein
LKSKWGRIEEWICTASVSGACRDKDFDPQLRNIFTFDTNILTTQNPMEPTNITPAPAEDKTVAILSYCTLIGFIVAIVLHGNNKTKLGSYHLKQALGVMLTAVAIWIAFWVLVFIPFMIFLMVFVMPIIWILILVLLIIGIVNAANGQMKPIPVFGTMYEKWFAGAFN